MNHEQHSESFPPRTPYEEATSGNPDPRTDSDFNNDWVDPRLIDIYQEAGIIGTGEDAVFSRDNVMEVARVAWAQGARAGVENPAAMSRFLRGDYSAAKQKVVQSQEEAAKASIADLPETPPNMPNN